MSPEATQGVAPTSEKDLFSVGVMLVEALSGHKLLTHREPHPAMQQMAEEDLQLPQGLSAEGDDALRSTLRRALQRDATRRWDSAAEFREARATWLPPPPRRCWWPASRTSPTPGSRTLR
jgi:eukaryotic-like serine/threonine-protein kinase